MAVDRITDGFPGGNRRSYISTEIFTSRFRSYRTYVENLITKGDLSQVTEDNSLCPKGRVLRENGRKLHPGANPGVGKYLVGVYDSVTFLNGFIDPNEHVFATFNTDKPYFADNDNDSESGSVNDNQSEDDDLGNPVYTRGNIETVGGDILANPIDTFRHNVGDHHFISLQNDVSGGNAAYFGFNDKVTPYVGLESDYESSNRAYLGATPLGTYFTMQSDKNSNFNKGLLANVNQNVSLSLSDVSGGNIYLDTSGGGNIYMNGLLHPYNSSATVGLVNGNYTLTVGDNLPTSAINWDPNFLKVMVCYGNNTSLSNPGTLYSKINTDVNGKLSTIVIKSTNQTTGANPDNNIVNYMIVTDKPPN
jgi:hypothetical protein